MNAEFIAALKTEVVPALGCTEPTTVALATAHCKSLLDEPCCLIEVEVSTHLYKNAMGVFVPGTRLKGLVAAAAAGWIAGDEQAGLEVLHKVTDNDLAAIHQLHDSGKISVSYSEQDDVLYTRVIAISQHQHCEVTIEHTHTGVTRKILNGKTLYNKDTYNKDTHNNKQKHKKHKQDTHNKAFYQDTHTKSANWSLNHLLEFIDTVSIEALSFMQDSEALNLRLSEEGLRQDYGAAVGRTLQSQQQKGWLADDLLNRAVRISAAASDARMGGAPFAAMSNSGSGNQGIAATLPVSVAADWLNVTDEQRIRALALSHLVAIYCKQSQPKLSALCAVTTASMGASAAICWLLGGTKTQIHTSINNMVGDVCGILCDGANAGCALKVSTTTASAVKAALLAIDDHSVTGEGIVAADADSSIANVGRISRDGLGETDRIVVTML